MMKTITRQLGRPVQRLRRRAMPRAGMGHTKILAALLVLFALLASACQPLDTSALSSPATTDVSAEQADATPTTVSPAPQAEDTEQEQAVLDLDSDTLDMDAPLPWTKVSAKHNWKTD